MSQAVVITGASGGVGRATTHAFAERGTKIALPADVADAGQVEAAAMRTEEKPVPIDVRVNGAFSSVFAPGLLALTALAGALAVEALRR